MGHSERAEAERVLGPKDPRVILMGRTYEVIAWRDGEEEPDEERGWQQEPEPATFREVVGALRGGCWDRLDPQHNGLIAYSADAEINYRTGEHTRHDLIVIASARNVTRILAATKEAA